MKINYKNYIIDIDNNKKVSSKHLNRLIKDATSAIDKIIDEENNLDVWEGWTVQDIIDELEPQFEQIMSNESWIKPFADSDTLKKWIISEYPLNNARMSKSYNYAVSLILRHFNEIIMDKFGGYSKYKNVHDTTIEYKGYVIKPYIALHDEDNESYKYEISKDGTIIMGVDSIKQVKEKIDENVTKEAVLAKDAKITIDFSEFRPWSGAIATWDKIVNANKLNAFEQLIDEGYPDGIDETILNDWLWFDGDDLLELLDIK